MRLNMSSAKWRLFYPGRWHNIFPLVTSATDLDWLPAARLNVMVAIFWKDPCHRLDNLLFINIRWGIMGMRVCCFACQNHSKKATELLTRFSFTTLLSPLSYWRLYDTWFDYPQNTYNDDKMSACYKHHSLEHTYKSFEIVFKYWWCSW